MKIILVLFLAVSLSSMSGCSGCDSDSSSSPGDAGGDGGPDGGENVATGGISVLNPDVRSCDLLLEEATGTKVKDIAFSDDVTGKSKQRSPKVSVSFIATEDAAFDGSLVTMSVGAMDGANPGNLDMPALSVVDCYDRAGTKVESPEVTF